MAATWLRCGDHAMSDEDDLQEWLEYDDPDIGEVTEEDVAEWLDLPSRTKNWNS